MRRMIIFALVCLLCAGVSTVSTAGARGAAKAKTELTGKVGKPPSKRARARARAKASARWRAQLRKQVKACKRKTYARKHKTLCKRLRGSRGPRGPRGPAGPAGPTGPGAPARADQPLRLLAINDLHGNLEPPTGSNGKLPTGPPPAGSTAAATTDVGGAAYLATHLKGLEAGVPNALFVGGGDLIGASPLISGLFHDEPTVEALNAMDMDVTGVGNHEFDEGIPELLRMQFGGCHADDDGIQQSCQNGGSYIGALYQWLAANVRRTGTDDTILPPYKIKTVGGIKVAFIGMTLEGTPDIVTPSGVAGAEFDEESSTVNRLVRQLSDSEGIESYVVLLHQGGQQNPPYAKGYQDVSGCENRSGDIFGLVDKMSPKVDVVVSAHTHQPYVCDEDGKLVTSASSFGRAITQIDLTLDGATGDVKTKSAVNRLVTRDVPADGAVQSIIDRYRALADPIAKATVGKITATIANTSRKDASDQETGESPLGDLIADSQLAATKPAAKGGAVVAFMNPGGIRAPLTFTGDGTITYNDIYTVQPFANTLVVKTMTGDMIRRLLEQQVFPSKVLQVSDGFTYTWKATAPAGSKVSDIEIDGTPVVPGATYKVTMNNFLATGGDGFTVFNEGTGQIGGDVDLDAFQAYLAAQPGPVAPPAATRITRVP